MAELRCARANVILLMGAAEPWNKALRRYGCCACRTLWKRDKIAAHQGEARCTRFVITEEELQDLDAAADSIHESGPPASSPTPPPAAPAAPTPSPSPAPAVPAAANGVAVPAGITSPPPTQAVEEIEQEATPMTRNSSPAELASQTASPSPRSQADAVAAADDDDGDGGGDDDGPIFAASVPPAPPPLCNGCHAPDAAAAEALVTAVNPAPTTTPAPAPDAAPVLVSVPVPVPVPAPVVAVAAAALAPSPPPPPAPKPVGPAPTYWAPALAAQAAESLKQVLPARHPDGHVLFTGEASEIIELCADKPKALSSDVLWVVAGKVSEEECVSPRGDDGSQEAGGGDAHGADEGLWVLDLPTLLQAQGGFFERYAVLDLDKGALHNLADHYTASKKACSTDERIPKPTAEYVQLPQTYKGEVLKVNDVYFSRPASDAGKLVKLCFREEEATPDVFEANTGRDPHLRIDKALQKEGLKTYEVSDTDDTSILQHVPAVRDYLVTYLDSTNLSAVRLRRKDGGDDGPTLGHVGPDLLGTWYTAAGPRAPKVHQACLDKAVAALT